MPIESPDDVYAELADLILNVSRLIRLRMPAGPGPGTVTLSLNERQVMRVVDLFPGSSPTRIADHTGLQRTNVSTALRALESKGMVERAPVGGRSVSVRPTELAATTLQALRSEWAQQLSRVLPGQAAAVRSCNELLRQLELELTTPDTR